MNADCSPRVKPKIQITVEWMIRSTNCIEEYVRMNSKTVSWYYANPELRLPEGGHGKYQKYKETIQCSDTSLQDHYKDPWKDVNHDIEQIEQEIQEEETQKSERFEINVNPHAVGI